MFGGIEGTGSASVLAIFGPEFRNIAEQEMITISDNIFQRSACSILNIFDQRCINGDCLSGEMTEVLN